MPPPAHGVHGHRRIRGAISDAGPQGRSLATSLIVPRTEDDPGAFEMAATHASLGSWANPVQVLFADTDPIFSLRAGRRLVDHIPGATELEVIAGAGHFLQEEAGPEVAARLISFLATSR